MFGDVGGISIVDIFDADFFTGTDSGESAGFSDVDIGTFLDVEQQLNALPIDGDVATSADSTDIGVAFIDADVGTFAETEALSALTSDNETAVGVDSGEAFSPSDAETATGTDAGEGLSVVANETEAITSNESGNVTLNDGTVAIFDSDAFVGADVESVYAQISDAEAMTGTEVEVGTDAAFVVVDASNPGNDQLFDFTAVFSVDDESQEVDENATAEDAQQYYKHIVGTHVRDSSQPALRFNDGDDN